MTAMTPEARADKLLQYWHASETCSSKIMKADIAQAIREAVADRVIVERIRPYLPDVPADLLLGLVKGTHVVVPREPTDVMVVVGSADFPNSRSKCRKLYKAMLAAAEMSDEH